MLKKKPQTEDAQLLLYQEVVRQRADPSMDAEAIYGYFQTKGISRGTVDAAVGRFEQDDVPEVEDETEAVETGTE